ncbi:MAG: hypothetical protein WBB67_09070 [bacterium]
MRRKAVLFIHGIGEQIEGYSDPLWNTLWQNENPGEVHKYELFYYTIFEIMNAKLEIDKLVKKYGLVKVLEKIIRTKNSLAHMEKTLTDVLKDTISHVLYFLLVRDAKNAILTKFKEKLMEIVAEAMAGGIYPPDLEITVISHSLGTVVAYTGLHSIIGEETLGLQDDLRIKNLFTLASPLELIREVSYKLHAELSHITDGIKKPKEWNSVKEMNESNVVNWYSYRHRSDPVASLVPLAGEFLDNEDEPPYVFNKIHQGNVHAFDNYMLQSRNLTKEKILEEQ